jgi:hypothetical protein
MLSCKPINIDPPCNFYSTVDMDLFSRGCLLLHIGGDFST